MKIQTTIILTAGLCLLMAGCTPREPATPAAAVAETPRQNSDEESVMAVLFQQQSAEYRALCLQAYHLAKARLQEALKKNSKMPLAVVTDLDETALDNGPEYAWMYRHNATFEPKQWNEWCNMKKADSIPGSVSFFKFADAQKVEIYYVSNRDTSQLAATMENMKKLGFPQLDKSHFLFKDSKESSKESRRMSIAKNHNIVLLLGDNLNDFAALFEGQSISDRKTDVDKTAAEWGEKYIVLPNAIYGEWENALYDYKHGLSIGQKDSLRRLKLQSFE